MASGRGTYFDALGAQWDYNGDWSDRRDGDEHEVLVLILSNLLCLMRTWRLREAKRPRPPVAGRACRKPAPFALHPAVWVAWLGLCLSCF